MNYLKIWIIVLGTSLITSFAAKSESYISTGSALTKYNDLLKNKTFLIFPELRENPIKWYDSIPENVLSNGSRTKLFKLSAQPGENYVYQVGIWALKSDISKVGVEFSELKSKEGKIIPVRKMTCFNTGGIDFRGNPFTKTLNIQAGRIQALWMRIDLDDVKEGIYTGFTSVIAGGEKQTVPIQLEISGDIVPNHGYNEGKRLSRLNWLNSTVGIDEEITKGYIPLKLDGNEISILGRSLSIGQNGLPASIISYFAPSNYSLVAKGEAIVANAFKFIIEKEDGQIIQLQSGKLKISSQTQRKIVWSVLNTSKECDLECIGQMEFDGFVDYQLKLKAKLPLKVKDIRLEIPVKPEKAQYMMGLGHEGGLSTPGWKWKWDSDKDQDAIWVGAVNGGVRVKLKDENYTRPLSVSYYAYGPLNLPQSWENGQNGGIDLMQKEGDLLIKAYSGKREIKKNDLLNFNFELLITPFKLIDKKIKYNDRYYHFGGSNTSVKIAAAKKAGANIINIHHAEDIYPFINYPYLDENLKELTTLVANAHKEDLRMKFYYTTRELTKNIPELWAFKSLDGEIIYSNPKNMNLKNPNDWLVKNLREKYIPAWHTTIKEGIFKGETDLAVLTTPDSRLNNYYIAGLDYMVQNIGIDGIYIDDTALDRFVLQRARKIIDHYRPEGRIDFHSWNHFAKSAGFASCLNLYMDLLPYFDFLWIGEGQDYNRTPDRWLIEISGIPFGLSGQMLEYGGNPMNPWRGMVYGITSRAGARGSQPDDIWKFWDNYKIENKEMIGYWDKNNPVICYNPTVKASIYKGSDESIIAVANWTKDDQPVNVDVDFTKLGYDPADCELSIPDIPDYQKQFSSVDLHKLIIPGGKGYLILIKRKS